MEPPLADRLVEVIADRGAGMSPRYRFGSGCIVRGRLVLTAAHVVADAHEVKVRGVDKQLRLARVDPALVGDSDGPGPDLAVLTIADETIDLPPMRLGAVDRSRSAPEEVERCHAIGYPWFAERKSPQALREVEDAVGHVPALSGLVSGLLVLHVSSAPRPLPEARYTLGESEWSGMSGAPVVTGDHLLGVVSEHAPRSGSSTITVTPLTALSADPRHPGWGPGVERPEAWWDALGADGPHGLPLLPQRSERAAPAYWATVRAVHARRSPLIGRRRELAEIAAFATGSDSYRWLVAGAWAGKTALLAAAAVNAMPDNVDVVCYFLSRRAADADSDRFLAEVVPQLAYLCERDPPQPTATEFTALWGQAGERARDQGRHLLLIVDGLDEDLRPPGLPGAPRPPSVAALLPTAASPREHVLVSSRPYPALPIDIPDRHPLRATPPTALAPFPGSGEFATLAIQELDELLSRDPNDLAVDLLGLLTAAAGPLSIDDLSALTEDGAGSAAHRRRVRQHVEQAARSLEPSGAATNRRYQFAHDELLERAKTNEYLQDPEFRGRIHAWAEDWRAAAWPWPADPEGRTPLYLLDSYPVTLTADGPRLIRLVRDVGWVDAAIQASGVDRVLTELRSAGAAAPADMYLTTLCAAVSHQAINLRPPQPVHEPGYVLRQLALQACELAAAELAGNARRRLRRTRTAHAAPVWTRRLTSSALSLVLGANDDEVPAVALLPDGRVVSGGADRRVRIWDPVTPGRPVELGAHDDGWVTAVTVLPGGRVVSGGEDGRLRIWDPATPGHPVELGAHDDGVAAVAVLPGSRVVSGDEDGRLRIWDPATPGHPVELGAHDVGVAAVAVLPGSRVVSGGEDGRLRIWDPATPGHPVELGAHDGPVRAVAVLPGSRVVSGGADRRVRIWDPATPGHPVELGAHDVGVAAVAVLPGGSVVTGSWDGLLRIWDPATAGSPVELGAHDGPVTAVAVLPGGSVVTGSWDGRLRIWDPATAGSPVELGAHDGPVAAVAVLPGGRAVTGDGDGRLRIWDPATPGHPVELGAHDVGVAAVAVLPGGHVVSGDEDGRLRIWDPATPGHPVELGAHDVGVAAVAVLPGGRAVSGGEDGRLRIWDPATPGHPVELGANDGPVAAVAVLPGSRVVSVDEDGRLRIWDPATPGHPVELGAHDVGVAAVAVLPGGHVVSGGWDGRLRIWDPATPGQPVELGAHDGPVTAVAVLPDGRVVSGSGRRLMMWHLAAAAERATLLAPFSVGAIATNSEPGTASDLVVAHRDGISGWTCF